MYYSGGTEIITLGRINQVWTDAVIDIKGIPECQTIMYQDDHFIIGSAVTLRQVSYAGEFPLLTEVASEVTDQTARNKITIGGNICGRIIYREAVLPFLLADGQVLLAGPGGFRTMPINQIFDQTLQLEQGELLVQRGTVPPGLS